MTAVRKNWLEWTVFAISLALTTAIVAFLAYSAWDDPQIPPTLEVRLGEVQKQTNQFAIAVEVTNHGAKTAEAAQIEVTLWNDGAPQERGGIEFEFVPQGALRRGWVVFENDPARADRISAKALGYRVP